MTNAPQSFDMVAKEVKDYADCLEQIPAESDIGGAFGHGSGLLSHLRLLYDAIVSRDLEQIRVAINNVWLCVLGDPLAFGQATGQGSIDGAFGAIDLSKVFQIIMLVLALFKKT